MHLVQVFCDKFLLMKFTFTLLCVGILVFIVLPTSPLQAQDPHFSQFYAAPLQVNPAMTGVFPGRFRAVINYREQWGSVIDNPFRTIAASFDLRHRMGKGDYIAYGLSALRDEAGPAQYNRVSGNTNLAYLKQLSGSRYRTSDQYLVAGVQVGFGQHGLDYSNLWFTEQYDAEKAEVNTSLPNGELINSTSDPFMDINAGLLWYALFDENASFYAGGALHHVNAPQISFLGNSSQTLYMRWLGQLGGEIPFTNELSILPAIMVTGQGPSLTSIFGLNFRYTNRDWREVAIRGGVWGQFSNQIEGIHFPSLIFTSILEMERLHIGISYDVNAGLLALPTNSRGAFELSMIYVHPENSRYKTICPKF